MNYTNSKYNPFIKKENIKTIFEVGSRDGLDAISLSNEYPESQVYSFECNPKTVDTCRVNIKNSLKKNIKFYDFALGKEDGSFPFYSYVKYENTPYELESSGSSSFFKRDDFDDCQKYIKDVKVKNVYNFCKENDICKIDLLCMDVQGYELNILKGCGELLHSVSYVILEVTKPDLTSIYNLSPSYHDINNFMIDNGFGKSLTVEENGCEDNILYTNKTSEK